MINTQYVMNYYLDTSECTSRGSDEMFIDNFTNFYFKLFLFVLSIYQLTWLSARFGKVSLFERFYIMD